MAFTKSLDELMDDVHLSTARHFCYEYERRKIFSSNLKRGRCARITTNNQITRQ